MKKINNIKLFEKVIANLIELTDKLSLTWKHFTYEEIRFFCSPEERIDWKLVRSDNNTLKELAKEISELYKNIKTEDVYFLLPQFFSRINSYILFDVDAINIDYYYILSDFLNFIPENNKPTSFLDYANNLDFFQEVIFKTLDKIDEDFKNTKIEFTLKLGSKNLWRPQEIKVDDKIIATVDIDGLTEIRGTYEDWYLWDRISEAFNDLMLIINILELNWIFHIEDTNKSIFHEKNYINNKKFDVSQFTFTQHINFHSVNDFYFIRKYLEKFYEAPAWFVNLEYFYLLSSRLKDTKLITASNFFWTDIFRFQSKEFLNYWQAIEVMLWSPDRNIKEELKSKFELFFPNTNYIEDFWDIRNWIVHRWVLHVHSDALRTIEKISKQLFLKLIVANYK